MPDRAAVWLRTGGAGVFPHRVAGRTLIADRPIAALSPFSLAPLGGARPPSPLALPPPADERPVYRGPAWVGGRISEVSCTRAGGAYVIRIAGLAPLVVDASGCAAAAGRPEGAVGGLLLEAVLGPGTLLAFALGGTFALHASAVAVAGRAALLVGSSGAGKSTIARAVAQAGGARLADDVVPFEVVASQVAALPHYPQLKLPPAAQYPLAAPERAAVTAVWALDRDAAAGVAVEPLGRRDATVLLARHTVASCLFDAPLLERQLAACAAAVTAVPVRRLRFAPRLETLPALVAALAADLGA